MRARSASWIRRAIWFDEYEEKLAKAQRKFDNFETLKKIQMQYEMDIITKEEYEDKVRNVLQ